MASLPSTLSHTHEAIARWMVMNPCAKIKDIAAEFGYNPNYISILTNSDAFQEKLRELNDAMDGALVVDLPGRLRGVASQALEKLGEVVEEAMTIGQGGLRDREFLLDTTDKLLRNLGYGPKRDSAPPAPAGATAVILADQAVVGAAVSKLMDRYAPPPPPDHGVERLVERPADQA